MPNVHPTSVYQFTKPRRFEPQFIGIAETLMERKQKRLMIQTLYNDTHNSLNYLEKKNIDLSKQLEQKQKQLQRLQHIKIRHQNDILNKAKKIQENKFKLQKLKRKNMFERMKLESSIRQRMSSMQKQKKHSKTQAQRKSQQLRLQMEESNKIQLETKKSMYETMKNQKQLGNSKIDGFYRKKNLQSLKAYNKNIKQQDKKSNFYQETIEKMRKTIETISKDNQKKKSKISLLDQDIQKLNPLKSFFTSRLNRSQFLQFSRKSSQKSISSKRPSQILLDQQFFTAQDDKVQNPNNLSLIRQNAINQNPQKDSFRF